MKVMVVALVALCLVACSGDEGDDEPDPSPTPAPATATATTPAEVSPTVTPEATTAPTGPSVPPAATPVPIENGDVIGTFLEPVRTMITHTASLGTPEAPDFGEWDRQSVALFDLETGTQRNFGPGLLVSANSGFTKLGYNQGGMLWVVDVATGEQRSYPSPGGLSTLIGDKYAVSPGGQGALIDLDTGATTAIQDIDDPELRYLVEQRLRPDSVLAGGFVLRRANWTQAPCSDDTEAGRQRCMAEAFEQWTLQDVTSGDVVLEFRAVHAAPAGPGELVIATSPQCAGADGERAWCEDVAAELRETLDRASSNPTYAEGTTNIFLVDIGTGQAEFVATAAYSQHPFIWPQNWPLIANQDYVIWTEAFCAFPPGKTRIYERASREITELEESLWVRWHGDHVGIGDFSSRAILDPAPLQYVAAVPAELSGVVWSPDFRYAAVGGVLGHGGLCG